MAEGEGVPSHAEGPFLLPRSLPPLWMVFCREGDSYVLNGHKWWTSGANDPRCKVMIFMGKLQGSQGHLHPSSSSSHPRRGAGAGAGAEAGPSSSAPVHEQQSMVLVPVASAGVRVVRPLQVFGFDDAPHGHAEVRFEDVRVPLGNMLLGEGKGFEIAQVRGWGAAMEISRT